MSIVVRRSNYDVIALGGAAGEHCAHAPAERGRHVASVERGGGEAWVSATAPVSEVSETARYTRVYAKPDGFPTPLSDSERPTGACASGAEAGESLDQAVLAIRARVPLDGQRDTIQPSPAFAAIYVAASKGRCSEMAVSRHPVR